MKRRAHTRSSCLGMVLLISSACDGTNDPSRSVELAEIAESLSIEALVLGTPDPATVHGLQVTLTSSSRDADGELICPVVDANATINGLAVEQTEHGGATSGRSSTLAVGGGCKPIQFTAALEDDEELEDDETVLVIEDASARVQLRASNIFAAPRAELAGGELIAGSTAELAILPGPEALPIELQLAFSGDSTEQSFSYRLAGQNDSELELTEDGLRFEVPDVEAGPGRLVITGIGHVDAFRGKVTLCMGAASCSVMRAACATASCSSAASVPTGFDEIALDAVVVAR